MYDPPPHHHCHRYQADDTAKGADAPVAKRRRSSRINSADRKSAVVELKPEVPVPAKGRKVTAAPVPVHAAAAPVLPPAASAAAVVNGSPTIVVSSFSDDDVNVFKPAPHKIREPKPLLDEEQARTICRNLRRREVDYGVSGQMKGAITHKMWAILVDWMIEVQVSQPARPPTPTRLPRREPAFRLYRRLPRHTPDVHALTVPMWHLALVRPRSTSI